MCYTNGVAEDSHKSPHDTYLSHWCVIPLCADYIRHTEKLKKLQCSDLPKNIEIPWITY